MPVRRKSLEIESPSSPNRKIADDFLNEGGEEYLESKMDLDQSDNQLISNNEDFEYENIPIFGLN